MSRVLLLFAFFTIFYHSILVIFHKKRKAVPIFINRLSAFPFFIMFQKMSQQIAM